MRADYDSEGDTLAIHLVDVHRADYGDNETHPQAVVAICDGKPVIVDVIGARDDVEEPLTAVAAGYDLDVEMLMAAARAALAAPDRVVVLDVLSRATA